MKVRVHFRIGGTRDFVVPENILAIDFQNMAELIGGRIRRLEFL